MVITSLVTGFLESARILATGVTGTIAYQSLSHTPHKTFFDLLFLGTVCGGLGRAARTYYTLSRKNPPAPDAKPPETPGPTPTAPADEKKPSTLEKISNAAKMGEVIYTGIFGVPLLCATGAHPSQILRYGSIKQEIVEKAIASALIGAVLGTLVYRAQPSGGPTLADDWKTSANSARVRSP